MSSSSSVAKTRIFTSISCFSERQPYPPSFTPSSCPRPPLPPPLPPSHQYSGNHPLTPLAHPVKSFLFSVLGSLSFKSGCNYSIQASQASLSTAISEDYKSPNLIISPQTEKKNVSASHCPRDKGHVSYHDLQDLTPANLPSFRFLVHLSPLFISTPGMEFYGGKGITCSLLNL